MSCSMWRHGLRSIFPRAQLFSSHSTAPPTARRVRTQADGVTWNRSRSGGSGGSRHGQQTSSPPVKLAFLGFLFGSAEQTSDENAEGTENTGRNNTVTLSPLEEAIRESDRLDREYDFREEYNLLNQFTDTKNPEILWRIARAIVSGLELTLELVTREQYTSLLRLANQRAKEAVEAAPDSQPGHLWSGITQLLLIPRAETSKVGQEMKEVNALLKRAVELNPADAFAWHWLGRWHFQAADHIYFYSLYVYFFHEYPPPSTYYDALVCFQQAEILSPGFRIDNLWQIAKTYARLHEKDKAYTLLWQTLSSKAFTDSERTSRDYAKQMLMANYNEEFHDDYDIPVTFHAQVQLGFASRHDYEKREEERRKERAVRKQMQEKQEWKDM